MSSNPIYASTKWKTLRTQVLKRDEHTCHWCGQHATTVDHITPLAQGGEPYDPTNLAAACKPCNYSRGGKLGRDKQLGRQRPLPEPPKALSLTAEGLPPIGHKESLCGDQTSSELEPVYGSVEPRIHSPLLDGPTLGDDVVEWARTHTVPLYPWQEWLLRDALRLGPDGKFRRKTVLMLVARQNGKTHLARVLMAYLMCTRPGFRIVGVAQKLTLAEQTWEQTVDLIRDAPGLAGMIPKNGVRLRNGSQLLRLANGSSYAIIAASRKARGFTADLIYVDELREVTPDAWAALQPFVTATGGQIWATSNAGELTSLALNTLRENIIATKQERSAIYEWSAPEKASVRDLSGWIAANPSMGYNPELNPATIEDALVAATTPAQFRTERLCQYVDAMNPAIPLESLSECEDTSLVVEPGKYPCWFAIDQTPDNRRADLVAAVRIEDRIALVPLATWGHTGAVDDHRATSEIIALTQAWNPQVVAYNQYAAGNIAVRLQELGHPTSNVTGATFAQACDELLSAVVHRRIVHNGDQVLVQHFAMSIAKPTADGGWRLDRRSSTGYISIACASAMALHHANRPATTPMVVFA